LSPLRNDEPSHLVEDMRQFDVGVDVAADRFDAALEQSQALTQAVETALAFARVPVQTGELALRAPLATGSWVARASVTTASNCT
jgi:hypothetical protein